MNEPMTPEQFAELTEKLQRQAGELGGEGVAALTRTKENTWNALSSQEQQRLTEQLRSMTPHADGGSQQSRP